MKRLEVVNELACENVHRVPIVFIHGTWHSAWCWLIHYFAVFIEAGFDCYAVSLRGCGESSSEGKALGRCTLSDFVADVRQAVEENIPGDVPPIIIGHSTGWRVAHHYAERYPVAGLVSLCGIPTGGVLGSSLRFFWRMPFTYLRLVFTLNMQVAISSLSRAQRMLFPTDMPLEQAEIYSDKLEGGSFLAYLQMLRPLRRRPTDKPILVVGAQDDQLFTQAEAMRSAEDLGADYGFYGGAHDIMLGPQAAVSAMKICHWITTKIIFDSTLNSAL